MGNILKMKKYILALLILILTFSACKNEGNKNLLKIPKETKTVEDFEYIIEKYKDFELSQHPLFQKKISQESQNYYDRIVEDFVEKETGFFKLFGELWDICFKSKRERKQIWEFKIDQHFRTTSFLKHIRSEVVIYTDGINNQRKNGVLTNLNKKHPTQLSLPITNNTSFGNSNKLVESIITQIDQEIYDQLISYPLEELLLFGILALVSIFGLIIGGTAKSITSIVISIISLFIFFIRSNNRSESMSNELKNECYKVLKSHKINYLDQLNKNTINYYSQLEKINYETNK